MSRVINVPVELNRLLQPVLVPLIRFGSRNDGGYLLPEEVLDSPFAVVSLGLEFDWSFEEALVARNSSTIVHSYDPTVTVLLMLKIVAKNVQFLLTGKEHAIWKRIKVLFNYLRFFRGPRRVHYREWIGESPDQSGPTGVSTIFDRIDPTLPLVLKVDIEGAEYAFLRELVETPSCDRISAIVIEFHDLASRWAEFESIQERLIQNFEIVHLHANNFNLGVTESGIPQVLEFSYSRRAITWPKIWRSHLPIDGLDGPNNPAGEDFEIVFANKMS